MARLVGTAASPCPPISRATNAAGCGPRSRFAPTTPLHLERFRSDEEGIRGELNSWAAFLGGRAVTTSRTSPYRPDGAGRLQTRQLFTLRRPGRSLGRGAGRAPVAVDLCRYLASETDGMWQCDDEGFFAADGTLLLKEY